LEKPQGEVGMEKETVTDRAKQELDKILFTEWTAKKLSEAYLNDTCHKIMPFILVGLPIFTRKRFEGAILKELEMNYDEGVIWKICSALEFFEVLLKRPSMDLMKYGKDKLEIVQSFRKKYRKMIKAADIMLETASALTKAEKETILQIKERCQNYLKRLPLQNEKAVVDPLKEALLALRAQNVPYPDSNTLASFAAVPIAEQKEWLYEFLCQMPALQKPASRPKRKLVENALLIVIFTLLEKNGKQIKWQTALTTDIVEQYFKKQLPKRAVETALHSSS
jgi:hypothetical protein